jgi:DNA-binding NarL/FixJ family response regulator
VHAKSPLAIREVIRTERPGGSAFVQLFPPAASSHATETMTDPMASRPVIDPQVVEALVRGRARVRASALKDLTPRELDVLREMAQGRGNAGIAAQLYLSESSVEKHVNAILTKLGLSSEQLSHRRVTAVLTFLRDAGLRAEPGSGRQSSKCRFTWANIICFSRGDCTESTALESGNCRFTVATNVC